MYTESVFLCIVLLSFVHFGLSIEIGAPGIEKEQFGINWTRKPNKVLDRLRISGIWNRIIGVFRKKKGLSTAKNATNVSAVAQFVKDAIKENPVVIFSKTYCPYCKMAKEVFEKLKQSYEAIEIDRREDAAAIQDVLEEMTGAKTVPRVFLNGECIGGGTDVKALYENGKLEQMLQKA